MRSIFIPSLSPTPVVKMGSDPKLKTGVLLFFRTHIHCCIWFFFQLNKYLLSTNCVSTCLAQTLGFRGEQDKARLSWNRLQTVS